MSIEIGKYEFDGPFTSTAYLEEKPGLYAVLRHENDKYELVYVGQANNIKECIELSETANRRAERCGNTLIVGYYPRLSGRRERSKMVEDILREFNN